MANAPKARVAWMPWHLFGAAVGRVVVDRARGIRADRLLVSGQRDPDLLQVVDALAPPRRLAGRLHGRQQQRDQHADDGDHHEQLDQRETRPAWTHLDGPRVDAARRPGGPGSGACGLNLSRPLNYRIPRVEAILFDPRPGIRSSRAPLTAAGRQWRDLGGGGKPGGLGMLVVAVTVTFEPWDGVVLVLNVELDLNE